MKILHNGIIREATLEEIAKMERLSDELPPHEPTPEERIAKLEEENTHLIEVLELLLSGATEVDGNG